MTRASIRARSAVATLSMALTALLAGGCVHISKPLHEDRQSLTAEHRFGSGLEVDADNGWVRVSRVSGNDHIEITAHVKATTVERAEDVRIRTDRTDDGFCRVSCDWPGLGRKDRESCSFEIIVPDADGVRVRTDNGSVRIVGLRGLAEVRTDNGSVTILEHDGPAEIASDNGSIEFETFGWPATIETDNGRVELRGVGTPLDVSTDNGSVFTALDPFAEGPLSIQTDNGAIVLEVGEAIDGSLEAKTDNGSISIERIGGYREYERRGRHNSKLFIRLGEADFVSRLTTDNGAIRVRPLDH